MVLSIPSWTKLSLFLDTRTPPTSVDSSNPDPKAQNIYPVVNFDFDPTIPVA